MLHASEAEERLRRSLAALRQEVDMLARPPERQSEQKDTFENTFRSTMDRIRKLLGFG